MAPSSERVAHVAFLNALRRHPIWQTGAPAIHFRVEFYHDLAVRAPLCRQLSALFILIGWTSAVVVCAIKPFAHCATDSPAEVSPHTASDDHHHHDAEPHQHNEASQHHPDEGEGGSDPTCADDPSCNAIYSALKNTSPALAEGLPATLLYEVFQLSTILAPDRLGVASATSKERVLLLTHEVCTSVSSLPFAPPSA